jgi:DNA-binding protein Fis
LEWNQLVIAWFKKASKSKLDRLGSVCYYHRILATYNPGEDVTIFKLRALMNPPAMQKTQKQVTTFLEKWLDKSIRQYVSAMDKTNNGHLHELIMGGIEKPLVEIVLKETNGNQTKAANILGINRNTLRKKIAEYKIKGTSKNK